MTTIYDKNSIYRTRLFKEFRTLEEDYHNYEFKKGENHISILVFNPKRENIPKYAEFVIHPRYPFEPPTILLENGTPYLRTIPCIPCGLLNELRTIDDSVVLSNKHFCVCCFITRHWVPTLLLSQVIERMGAIQFVNLKVTCLERMKKRGLPIEVIRNIILYL